MKKFLFSFVLAIIGLSLLVAPAHAVGVLQDTMINYFTAYNPGFVRSSTPFSLSNMWQTKNADGSVTVGITRVEGYGESGFVIYYGKLGDLNNFVLTGTGDEYGLNIWFDKSGNGDFFNWTGDTYNNVDGDSYILGPTSVGGTMNITDLSPFTSMQPGGGNYTVAQLKAGDAAGINSDTKIALWVGVCCSGTKAATINLPTPAPTPTPLVCTGDQHLDASGRNCVSWSPSGPAPRNDEGVRSQVLGASTIKGQVLGASTMAKTGGVEENIYLAIMSLGGLITAAGATVLKKLSVSK